MTTITGPWHDAITDYLAHARLGGAPRTTLATRRAHLHRVARALGVVDPWTVDVEHLRSWWSGQSWARETRRAYRTTLRSFYAWGLEDRRVTTSPATGLPPVRPAAPRPRPTPDAALATALAAADPRARLMLLLAAQCGMRRAEVAQVHARDLVEDLTGWSLVVHGKGDKERVVPVPDALAASLRLRLRTTGGYAFPGADGGHLSPRWVGKIVGGLLPDGWTMHSLRHRFATRAYAHRSDVFAVQELLGHASPATTRAYVAVAGNRLRATVEAAAATAA